MIKEYSVDVQKLFLEMMLEDASRYVRVQNIFNPTMIAIMQARETSRIKIEMRKKTISKKIIR